MNTEETKFFGALLEKMDALNVAVVNNMDADTFKTYTEALTLLIDKTDPQTLNVEIGARPMDTGYGDNKHKNMLIGFRFQYQKPKPKNDDDE